MAAFLFGAAYKFLKEFLGAVNIDKIIQPCKGGIGDIAVFLCVYAHKKTAKK